RRLAPADPAAPALPAARPYRGLRGDLPRSGIVGGTRYRRAMNTGMRPLADRYGRVATDLRVSLTDRCNLRCGYCMPPEGLPWLPTPTLLTDDEVVRLARIGVERLGITEIRYTGGEPLLRRGLPGIVARTAA